MLFFTRACLCIGAIVVLAEGLGPADIVRSGREAAGTLGPAAAGPVAALCRRKPDTCAALAAAALQTGTMDAPVPPMRAHSTIEAHRPVRPAELSSRTATPR